MLQVLSFACLTHRFLRCLLTGKNLHPEVQDTIRPILDIQLNIKCKCDEVFRIMFLIYNRMIMLTFEFAE